MALGLLAEINQMKFDRKKLKPRENRVISQVMPLSTGNVFDFTARDEFILSFTTLHCSWQNNSFFDYSIHSEAKLLGGYRGCSPPPNYQARGCYRVILLTPLTLVLLNSLNVLFLHQLSIM